MAIYQTRNCICAVQWDPEDKQSLENIKALAKDNPRLGWRVNDNSASLLQMKFLGMPLKNWFGRTAVTAPLSCTMTPSSAFGRLSGT